MRSRSVSSVFVRCKKWALLDVDGVWAVELDNP